MKNYELKIDIKNKGIKFYSNYNEYNCFLINKKTKKTNAEFIFDISDNNFIFVDNKTNKHIDLKQKTSDELQKYLKILLENEEIGIVLFNDHFVLSGRKDCCDTLKYLIDINWKNPVIKAYNDANLIRKINYDYNCLKKNRYYGYNTKLAVTDLVDACNSNQNDIDISKAPESHIDFTKGFIKLKNYLPNIENKNYILNCNKANKITNSLYWTNKITGLSFEKIAEIFIEQNFEIDELPYNNFSERILNKIMEDIINKIKISITKKIYINFITNPTIIDDENVIKDRKELNLIREGNLCWTIAYVMYTDTAPDDIDIISIERYKDRWWKTRKAFLLLSLSQEKLWSENECDYTLLWNEITYDCTLSTQDIYEEFTGMFHENTFQIDYETFKSEQANNRKHLIPIIEKVYKKTDGKTFVFLKELEKEYLKEKYNNELRY